MRKIIIFLSVIFLIIFAALFYRFSSGSVVSVQKDSVQEIADNSTSQKEEYIFVPYWTIDSDIASAPFDTLIYFGIEGSTDGINNSEAGHNGLEKFVEYAGVKDKLLTVRLLNFESNSAILKSEKIQGQIISDSIALSKKYGFNGIVLDLEMQGLPFESLINRITDFNKRFSDESHKNNLTFGTLIYGDVYHRIRPYDVKKIGDAVDRIYVMGYDFSKSRGNPGPNFPLAGADIYGYDFKTMVMDFKKEVPTSKLTFIFGMFGYEWMVDEKGKSVENGTAKTTLQMERMVTRCVTEKSCTVALDPLSQETKAEYTLDGKKYISFFETSESSQEKINYLKQQGLHSIGWWAYSYF